MKMKQCLLLTEEDVEHFKPTIGSIVSIVLVPLSSKDKFESRGNQARIATHPLTIPQGNVLYYSEGRPARLGSISISCPEDLRIK